MGGEVGVEVIFLIVVVSGVLGLVWKCGFFCHGLRIVKIAYWLRALSTTALLPPVCLGKEKKGKKREGK